MLSTKTLETATITLSAICIVFSAYAMLFVIGAVL